MKRIISVILFFVCLALVGKGQGLYINFPDTNFQKALLNHNPKIDLNNDGKIDTIEAKKIHYLNIASNTAKGNINDISGIEYFSNLDTFNCCFHCISSIDVSKNINLIALYCTDNYCLKTIDISNCKKIKRINDWACGNSDIITIYVWKLPFNDYSDICIDGHCASTRGVIFKLKTNPTHNKENISNNYILYPNPATDYININVENNSEVKIYNISGQIVGSQNIVSKEQRIDILNLPKGVYIVEVISKDNISHSKIIKE